MTEDDIIKLAKEAGFMQHMGVIAIPNIQSLERFTALVAAAEREACAKAIDDLSLAHPGRADLTALQCADAIRARGERQ
jgi:hypothetical protein